MSPAIAAAITAFVTTAIFGLLLYCLYRLLKAALRLLLRGVGLDGLPPFATLISLAIAATLFSEAALSVWYMVYALLQLAFVEFPRVLVETSSFIFGCSRQTTEASPASACFVQVGVHIVTDVKRFFDGFFQYFGRVTSILQFFATWAVLAWLLGEAIGRQSGPTTARGLYAIIQGLSHETRVRLGLSLIIAVGAYLCLCAILAVSLFKSVEKNQQLDTKHLEENLKVFGLTDDEFKKRYPEALGEFPKPNEAALVESNGYKNVLSEYNSLGERWSQLRQDAPREQERLRKRALEEYEINSNRIGSREQANHFLSLEKWYQTSVAQLFEQLDSCRSAILVIRSNASVRLAAGGEIAGFATLTVTTPGSPAAVPGGQPTRPFLSNPIIASPLSALLATASARRACQSLPTNIEDPPTRGDFGYSLGILGAMAAWLLRTESTPLAVICGLVGFGLFGALVSTFIRATSGQTVQLDIFGIVYRGVSAAIVVFLAAYAGIAVVSQTPGDPNPYLVFVTCLVGAVFGDDVWGWAKNRFVPKGDAAQPDPAQAGAGNN